MGRSASLVRLRENVRFDGLWWRKFAYLGCVYGPEWFKSYSPPLFASVIFALVRENRRHAVANMARVMGPVPGVEIKMVPNGAKLELRVRGPNVTPGYLGDPALTAAAFDEEGFYRIGDAGAAGRPRRPVGWDRLRRAHRRGLQAQHRHLGERHVGARRRRLRGRPAGVRRGGHRP